MKLESNLFFELIRVAIGRQECLSRTPSAEEWQELYEQAERQALLGVCFAGVRRLTQVSGFKFQDSSDQNENQNENLARELYFQWLGMAMQIQMRNEVMNKHCVAVGSKIQDAGFKCSILKGQGIAQLYKVSGFKIQDSIDHDLKHETGESPMNLESSLGLLRQSGDIDLWVDGGMEKALTWARENYGDVEFDYINANLPMFDETEVELHWRVSMMTCIPKNRRLQRWIEAHKEELQNTTVELPEGAGNIHVPSLAFNRWYILLHCYNHIFSEGLGLRQIMDLYFVLVSSFKIQVSGDEFADFFLKELGLKKFASAMMWIMDFVFGLEREKMLCEPDEKEGRYILNEVMQNGNMGHHDERIKRVSKNAKLQYLASAIQHNWHLATHYPSEFFWTPVWMVWHWCWKHFWFKVHG